MRNSQKGIIIGHKGLGLKRIGSESRRDIEKMLGKKFFRNTSKSEKRTGVMIKTVKKLLDINNE